MYIIYNLVISVAFIFILPYFLYRSFCEKGFPKRFRQSLGRITDAEIAAVAHKDCIWIHGASVGEIVATSPLVKEIRKAMPEVKILVSAVTTGGYDMAHQIIPEADAIIYFPLDLPFVSESFVKRIMPRVFLPVETELWPNFLRAVRLRKIPVMMVNGRISDKSVKSYRYLYGILEDMLGSVTRFCMQSSIDAEYIVHLGADKSKIFITGNTKFDQTYAEVTPEDLERYKQELGITDCFPVIVGGSTHPSEEKALFDAFKVIQNTYPKARLIIAPRKTARIDEIVKLSRQAGFEVGLRSQLLTLVGDRPQYPVLLIDTIGELGRIYAVGDIVFVGGSLIKHGGHNVLEPAAHAKPIIVGPNMYNFKDSFALLNKVGACRQIKASKELVAVLLEIIGDDTVREQMGKASLQVICENRGAAVRSIDYLRELMDLTGSHVEAHYKINTRNINDEGGTRMRRGDAVTQYLYQLAHGHDNTLIDWLVLGTLRCFSVMYELGVRLKLSMYKHGLCQQSKLSCCVISIGNITVGGTGKTPTAQKMAVIIQNMGYRVVILNRGYRSHWEKDIGVVSDGKKIYMTAYEAGDEAYLMAKTLPGIPVVIGKKRSVTGEFAVNKLKAEVIIMDDGYQHWQLYRDLDVVLVDTLNMFGNGCLLPRGTLREPLANLDRAGMFLLTKTDQSSTLSREVLRTTLEKHNALAPVIESVHRPCNYVEIADWYKGLRSHTKSLEDLAGQSVMVFSAIGNPSSFEQTLTDVQLNIEEAIRYPDHHDYGMLEMQYIMERAIRKNVTALITTAKDAVKIPTEFIYFDREVPLYVLNMEIQITEGRDAFQATILQAIAKETTAK
ncbi:MAG: tetraacyldisaccharide 4'-kinase [Acidaminococcaceae bacterium]